MKEVKLEELKALLQSKVIKNTNKGFVDQKGLPVGFYKTCHDKRDLEDKYADIAKSLV